MLATLSISVLIFSSVSAIVLPIGYAHAEEEAAWMPVHQVEGNLVASPDSSLPQWIQSHHGSAGGLDGVRMHLLSVHNGTYLVLLIRRAFNASLDKAGVSVRLNGTVFNSQTDIWGWVGGQNNSTDPNVNSEGILTGQTLTVIFGRPLLPTSGSGARLNIGVAYDDAVKITSWNNGTAATTLRYDGIDSMGLELLPHIDLFPKTPFVYSGVLLVALAAFILLEARRYR